MKTGNTSSQCDLASGDVSMETKHKMKLLLESWSKLGFYFTLFYNPDERLPWCVTTSFECQAVCFECESSYEAALGLALWKLQHGDWDGAAAWAQETGYKFTELWRHT